MILTPELRFLIDEAVMPKLTAMGLWACVDKVADPEDADYVQDALVVYGSAAGPYRTSKLFGELLLAVEPAFADLLVTKGLVESAESALAAETWAERAPATSCGTFECEPRSKRFLVSPACGVAA